MDPTIGSSWGWGPDLRVIGRVLPKVEHPESCLAPGSGKSDCAPPRDLLWRRSENGKSTNVRNRGAPTQRLGDTSAGPTVKPGLRRLALAASIIAIGVILLCLEGLVEVGLSGPLVIGGTAGAMLMAARSPLVTAGERAEVIVLLDTTVYVVVSGLVPPTVAIPAIAAGLVASSWSLPMSTWVRITHSGAATSLWAVLVALRFAFVGPDASAQEEVVAALALGLLGELGTLVIVAFTARASSGRDPFSVVRQGIAVETAAGAAQGGLGAFALLMLRSAPAAAPFLLVPIGMIMVVSRALVRAQRAHIRSAGLSNAVVAIQHASNPGEAESAAIEHAARMVRSSAAAILNRPPYLGELGSEVPHPRASSWLVVEPRNSGAPYSTEDEVSLSALASVLGVALRNLELLRAMEWRASHDPLTGLPNRTLLVELGAIALQQRREGTLVAVLFIDLDGFKSINDDLGHEVGDEVLRVVARRMTETIMTSDTAARLGGDEFCVVLRDVRGLGDVRDLADEVAKRLSIPVILEGHGVSIGASVGIAVAPADGHEIGELLRVADQRMYEAKADRRRSARQADTKAAR